MRMQFVVAAMVIASAGCGNAPSEEASCPSHATVIPNGTALNGIALNGTSHG